MLFQPENIKRLSWLSYLGVALLVVMLEVARRALRPFLDTVLEHLLLDAVVLAGALFFFAALFRLVEKLQSQLERQNRELLALHEAGLGVQSELALDALLQLVVDHARQLIGARYGALSVIGKDNRIESFITSGISAEQRQRIGDPPTGHGLLGVTLHEGRRLRLREIVSDPRTVGFPAHHPLMRSLLAVPVPAQGAFRGNLYLADNESGAEFSPADEETLTRFATAAAIAIDNAAAHQRLRTLAVAEERVRIAHELHDGTAQVLAYVNAKAQAVAEFLRAGRLAEADAQLDQLAQAAREVYADVRDGILGLRTAVNADQSLSEALTAYLEIWCQQSGLVPALELDPQARLPPPAELQVLRIVQEALANVRKHANATKVGVTLRRAAAGIEVVVSDDGSGFDPEHTRRGDFPRFGLATMRERAESAGGSLRVESSPRRGTHVTLRIPIPTTAPPKGDTT